MQLTTFVVNRWTQPRRWNQARRRLERYPGLKVYRWPGVEPDTITLNPPRSGLQQPYKRLAILAAYRTLFEHLRFRKDGPWLILQDDIYLTADPRRPMPHPLHLYGGYTGNPTTLDHVHPFAFQATPDAVTWMLSATSTRTKQLCEAWTWHLTPDNVTYDDPPTATHLEVSP